MSNFPPNNEDICMEFTIRDGKATGNDWADILNMKIDNESRNYSSKENIMLVNKHAGGFV